MTRAEIQSFFPVTQIHFGAASYGVPTLAWIRGPFWDFIRGRWWDENLTKWKFNWACRDFTRAAASAAQECNALTQGSPYDVVAIGEFWFVPDSSKPTATGQREGHAVCPCFTDTGLVYMDFQTCTPWPLTTSEFQSRYFLRF